MRVVVVECNNHMMSAHQEPNIPAPGRPKLRPLIPKPFSNIFSTLPTPTPTPTPTSCGYGYRSDNIIINAVPLVSTRWNPTTEQLQALEEMYGQGIRNPSAQQIQQITAKLRGFGKIEGKNVFYWFQNHKARERQRKRRQMEFFAGEKRQSSTGVGRRYLETTNKHPKELPPTPATSEQQGASVHVVQECKEEADNWRHWNCKELQTSEKRCCWPLPLEVLSPCIQENEFAGNRNGNGSFQTLDLFPVKADIQQQQQDMSFCNAYSNKPNHFFEFLPTKNY